MAARKALMNYTTKVASDKSIGEIESLLVRSGALKIMKEYDDQGGVRSLNFILKVGGIEAPFMLPLREERILEVLVRQRKAGKLPRRFCTKEQAKRIGWRILRDWVDSQLAMVEIGIAQMEEVFMPYLVDVRTKRTLYQIAKDSGFDNTVLPMLAAS